MFFAYDGIWFDLLHLEDWHREAMYSEDNSTFLWWEHTIRFAAILNTEATAANRFPPLVRQPRTEILAAAAGGRRREVGGPAVVREAKPIKLEPAPLRGDLDAMLKPGQTRQEFFDDIGPTIGSDLDFFQQNGLGGLFERQPTAGPRPRQPQGVKNRDILEAVAATLSVTSHPSYSSSRPTVPHTDQEIRQRMRRPRRQMLVGLFSGPGGAPEFILASPLPGCDVDARVGPVVKIIDTVAIHGQVTGVYMFEVTTWEAPALEWGTATVALTGGIFPLQHPPGNSRLHAGGLPDGVEKRLRGGNQETLPVGAGPAGKLRAGGARQPNAAKDLGAGEDIVRAGAGIQARVVVTPALVSNRWSMAFVPNKDTWLVDQKIEGEALFRADVLALRKLTADQLRAQLWHPIPIGYVRNEVEVEISPDGLGVKYQFVDNQQLMNFPGGSDQGVIHVEVVQNVHYRGYDLVEKS